MRSWEATVLKSEDKTRGRTVQLTDAARRSERLVGQLRLRGRRPDRHPEEDGRKNLWRTDWNSDGQSSPKIEQAAAWRKPESALTDYDYVLRSAIYTEKWTLDDNLRARKLVEEGLGRFPNSALLKVYLAWTYQFENEVFGPFANCHETAENQYRLGREAEDAKISRDI